MVFITREAIDLEKFFSQRQDPASGAAVSFVGMVRNHDHGLKVQKLFYECYFSMAEKKISGLIDQAKQNWPLADIRVCHRVGELQIGEAAVAIAVSSAHRDEAFRACRFLIEGIKREVPIWKKQILEDGSGEWVACHHEEEIPV